MSPRLEPWHASRSAAALMMAVAVAYAPVLWNGLVWDDVLHITANPHIRSVAAAAAYLFRPEGAYYRPLTFLAYAVEHAVWGTAPVGYHVVNVVLHAVNVLLLLTVARRSGLSAGAALLGAAVFALHPLQVEAVAYVSGRTDLLMTAGALLSWIIVLTAAPPLLRGLGAAAAGVIAMLSKESGYALVLFWPWLAWRHGHGVRERLALAAPGMIGAVALLALRPAAPPADGITLGSQRLAAVGQAVATYVWLLLWPVHLQIDRLTLLPDTALAVAGGLVSLATALMLAAWGLSRRGVAADYTAWTIAFYLPAANLVAVYPAIADRALFTPEHNLYAPLAGIVLLTGLAVEPARARLPPRWRQAVVGTVVAVLALYALRTATRCATWHDEERLFGAAVASGSRSPRVWYNYGNALLQRGADQRAAEAFTGATQLAPNDAPMWMNLGVALQRQRAYEPAERAYRRAAELAPGDAQTYENLGSLYAARGDLAASRAAFATALHLDPQRVTARDALRAIDEFEGRRW